MVIDFSKIDLKEHPTLVLRNLDGTAIQTLGQAFNIKCELYYNQISKITFDIPAFVDGVDMPHYDDIVGTRIVDVLGIGQFILMNPKTVGDGIKEIKSCTAYSLEYELTYKKITLEEGTYNFGNGLVRDNTVIGIILSYLPSWTIGEIDEDLIGKYRTFSVNGENIYDFIKSTVQKTYGCIFDFDTANRKIYVRAVSNEAKKSPVYLSYNNLAKEIEVKEDTENILTVLDVYGADGVDIRSVNPMGTNKIYNLDYYMNTTNFSQDIIGRWNKWKESYDNYQPQYYNLTIQKMLKTSAILTEENRLLELTNEDLAVLENQRSVEIEYLASTSNASSEKLKAINKQIQEKNVEIKNCKSVIEELNKEKDELTAELVKINKETAFLKLDDEDAERFTEEELKILDRYFKEDTLEDSSFVITETESYVDSDWSNNISSMDIFIKSERDEEKATEFELPNGEKLFNINFGRLTTRAGSPFIEANIIKASLDVKEDKSFVFSGHLGNGKIGDLEFTGGCISITGTYAKLVTDVIYDDENFDIGLRISSSRLYFTKNTTEYEKFSVEWDLYKYGCDCLKKLAYPSYSFDVSSANFLSLDEFYEFSRKISLGNKIYLEMKEGRVLNPIFVGVSFDFDNLSSLKLQFGDTYNLSDSSFSLVDLLEQSVSMGKKFDMSRFNYNSFIDSGASTAVKEFMNSALDVAKNAILSGSNMAISWDSSGIHCRKWKDDTLTDYEPEEIAIINNSIVFTDDNWQTAKMAIGKVIDENIAKYPQTSDETFDENKTYYYKDNNGEYQVWEGSWNSSKPTLYEKDPTAYGIVAPYIVGTILAGQNLVITTEDGAFRVDSSGVHIDSMKFFITHGSSSSSTGLYEFINEDGYLTADKLQGVIDAQETNMKNGAGNVMFDNDGIWLLNGTQKSNSTKAIWMNESGIVFGSGDPGKIDNIENGKPAWTWTTAIGHEGITAEALASKTLSSVTINGGSINIGTKDKNTGKYPFTVGTDGTLNIGNGNFVVTPEGVLTANSGSFSGTVKATSFSMTDEQTISSKYLSLKGLTIKNDKKETTFEIDEDGNVTIDGIVTLGAGSSISWDEIDETGSDAYSKADDAANAVEKIANGTYSGGTFINEKNIYSPVIYANEFSVHPQTSDTNEEGENGGFNLYGYFNTTKYHMLRIGYWNGDAAPRVRFYSPDSAYANWEFTNTYFSGNLDFSSCDSIDWGEHAPSGSSVAVFG